ncbi:hypothetical protein AgCh_034409 [Apium graveolens]
MEGIKEAVEEHFGTSSSSYQPGSTSTNLRIQSLQGQVTALQDSNSSLTAQVQALTSLVKNQQTDIQTLVDSHKHLQMQNSIALGAIMGKLNIPLPSLPEQVRPEIPTPLLIPVNKTKGEIEARLTRCRSSQQQVQGAVTKSKEVDLDMERLIRSAEGPSLIKEFEELLKALKASLNNNHFTYKKALDKTINFIRVIKVNKDNFLEERIVVNANDSGTDRCLKVRAITREDTMLLNALRDAQVASFPKKKNDQNPSGSNPSQSSKPSGSKGGEKKKEDAKKDEEKKRRDEDHFQHLAGEIVRVWIVSLREVRVYFKDAEWLIKREETKKRDKDEVEERRRRHDEKIDMSIKRLEELKAKEVIEDNVVITKARTYAKEPEDFALTEKEEASLNVILQLILVDSLDPLMNRHVMNCKNSKHIWETIEVINEGTEKVRENKLEILTSEEINKKFLLTLPTHLEHRITAIREARDLSEISLERLYGVLKTYELEQIQQKEVYGKGRVVSTSTALVAEGQQQQQQSQQSERTVQSSKAEENVIVAEYDPPTTNQSGDDFYSLE